MIKDIIKDDFFLQQKSLAATKEDLYIVDDLLDTIQTHRQSCVGMAANMIGYLKTIMVVCNHDHYLILINPQIMKCSGKCYETNEGCLSHEGTKMVKRYPVIKVSFLDRQMKKRIKTYSGLTAQIIQHEMDHFSGLLV